MHLFIARTAPLPGVFHPRDKKGTLLLNHFALSRFACNSALKGRSWELGQLVLLSLCSAAWCLVYACLAVPPFLHVWLDCRDCTMPSLSLSRSLRVPLRYDSPLGARGPLPLHLPPSRGERAPKTTAQLESNASLCASPILRPFGVGAGDPNRPNRRPFLSSAVLPDGEWK